MPDAAAPSLNPIPLDAKARRWSIRAITVLTALESALLTGMVILQLSRFDWEEEFADVLPTDEALDALLLAIVFLPLALLSALIVIGLIFGKRSSWILAMLLQALILLAGLVIYVNEIRPSFLFLFMLFAVLMTFLLNSSTMRMAFFARPPDRTAPIRDY